MIARMFCRLAGNDFFGELVEIKPEIFSLMNRTISMLSVQLYKPDVLVNMNFDSYGAIPDYAKGEEIAAKGRELMSGALDEYESRATSPASPA